MAGEIFPFTSSTTQRSLRLQREWLDWEDQRRRRVVAQQCLSHRCPRSPRAQLTRPRCSCRDPAVHNALFSGDLKQVQALFQDEEAANMIMETVSNQLAWSAEQGFWVMTPKTNQTAPLTITAARGYTDCVRHLIHQGAELDACIGGWAALHKACSQAQVDCVQLLLTSGAKTNVLSEEGTAPLHLCTAPESLQCAKLLLEAGAKVNLAARESEMTPLHVAAARGLEEHVVLYLDHGANVGLRTSQGETALNTACAAAEGPGCGSQHEAVALRLLEAGADARAAGRKRHTPLHNACANGCASLAELLLSYGAQVGVPNGAGHTPMDCALQAIHDIPNWEPEVLFKVLLDYGAQPVRPEMLKLCASFPPALEVLLNAYTCVPACDTWTQAVLPELWQEHEAFYRSALCMVNQPRKLQHLARLAVRVQLGGCCRQAATQLPLPPLLRNYLLLCVEGHIQ
ncbi:PREDICTED: LOW QUALITY PROTEIN: ankyrin repeat and SOCS box protein 16 [Chrysochloris asiatica]|uniref:LOW QUALITY PROTEIN: ankyrin repeat and SOCS box protein 16 n=1 Tax=Chrysochloris asiatica TaxID=185453 RepID=A0A9B0WHU9_CHRAS|nr:PREDICTED: LOW QUALITY PROTEIN: ankyrin repeat and SOCS box protein 16 [Chrysochloris asiatica]